MGDYPHYHYGFLKTNEETQRTMFLVTSERRELLAFGEMRLIEPGADVYEIMATVARPGFGRLLYQGLAKLAHHESRFVTCARDGDTRGPALEKWDEFYENISPHQRKRLDAEWNQEILDFLTDEEAAPYCYGYHIPADKRFVEALSDLKKEKHDPHWGKLVMQGGSWWEGSYENDDNLWINESYPLDNDTLTARDFPYTTELSLDDVLIIDPWLEDVDTVPSADSMKPVKAWVTMEGECIVCPTQENASRLSGAMRNGESLRVSIERDERVHGYHPEYGSELKRACTVLGTFCERQPEDEIEPPVAEPRPSCNLR